MRAPLGVLLLAFLDFLAFPAHLALAQERPLCHDWTECRQFALKAYADHDAEAFHDFARRSLAAGPPADVQAMFLLARPPPTAPTSPNAPIAPFVVALRIPATRISPTCLAYDHVSGRFLMADGSSDKLVSVDELSRHMVDLVKAESAGFRDITAFEIDT